MAAGNFSGNADVAQSGEEGDTDSDRNTSEAHNADTSVADAQEGAAESDEN
jgi:hypothetical protein